MEFLKDEGGQGAAEYILLFGGIIVIVLAALIYYKTYINGVNPLNSASDISSARGSLT